MFDIGFLELLLIGIISLLIMGPERLPHAIRTGSLWLSRIRRSFQNIKMDIEREIGAEDIKQQIHNESIMKSLEKTKSDLQDNLERTAASFQPDIQEEISAIKNDFAAPTSEETLSDAKDKPTNPS